MIKNSGAPPRPSGFSVTECTSSLIAVQWDLPSLDGVAHELSYRIDNSNNGSWGRETVESGATSYKLENLRPNTSYVLRLTASRNSIRSLPTSQLIVRTRISVPRDVRSFKVDSTASPGTFVLTWQAPLESVVDYYIVYVRGPYNNTIEVDGTKLGLSISDLSENVEYMFAIQAVNDGGSGNMTSYRSGIFCLTTPMITAQYRLHRTTVNISWHLSDSIYSMRNIMLVIAEQSGTTFTSELIDATNRQRCISNLRLNTRYEITVIAILGCDNVSSELDVLTQSTDKPATRLPSQNCIVFNATTSGLVSDARSGSDGRSSNSSAISSGFVGGVILLLLMITVVLCIVLLHKRRSYRKAILSLNFNVEKDSGNDVMPDLCNTIEPGDSDDPITTNPIYATITEASEDKCKYVQTNDFDEYLDLEDTVTKMNTNPLYGVNTGNVHSASNAQSSNETDYGVVNQPKSDGPDSLIT